MASVSCEHIRVKSAQYVQKIVPVLQIKSFKIFAIFFDRLSESYKSQDIIINIRVHMLQKICHRSLQFRNTIKFVCVICLYVICIHVLYTTLNNVLYIVKYDL